MSDKRNPLKTVFAILIAIVFLGCKAFSVVFGAVFIQTVFLYIANHTDLSTYQMIEPLYYFGAAVVFAYFSSEILKFGDNIFKEE